MKQEGPWEAYAAAHSSALATASEPELHSPCEVCQSNMPLRSALTPGLALHQSASVGLVAEPADCSTVCFEYDDQPALQGEEQQPVLGQDDPVGLRLSQVGASRSLFSAVTNSVAYHECHQTHQVDGWSLLVLDCLGACCTAMQ